MHFTYQCPGCIHSEDCFIAGKTDDCLNHKPATFSNFRKILLGFNKGFSILPQANMEEKEYKNFEEMDKEWGFDKFNIPLWKGFYNGKTIVKGICPRIVKPFFFEINENCLEKIDCIETKNFKALLNTDTSKRYNILLFKNLEAFKNNFVFNERIILAWKQLDENGNTVLKGFDPYDFEMFLIVIEGNHLKEFKGVEISLEDSKNMD